MCGIVGIISKHGSFPFFTEKLFVNLLRGDTIRGDDSTGVFGVTKNGHSDILKGNTDGYLFTRTKQYQKFEKRIGHEYRIIVGHNRSATFGEVTAENAHPFREKHIVLVHNGTIHNKDQLNKEVEVDSHAICYALAEHDPVSAMGKIDGAYALVWWDESDRSLCMARNSQRPLYVVDYDSVYIICSEPGLPIWLNARDNRKANKIEEVPTEKIIVLKLDSISKGFFEVPYEEFKYWKQPKEEKTYPIVRPVQSIPHFQKTRSRNDSNVVDLTAHSKPSHPFPPIKTGDEIFFKLEDSQETDGVEVLIGHPMFDDIVDENIFVRIVLPKDITQQELLRHFDNEYYKGIVQYFRSIQGMPVIFVHDFEPYDRGEDGAGNSVDNKALEDAVKVGCNKCSKALTVDEAKKGIARRRKNGSWRLVCPACLEKSISTAMEAKPGVNFRERVMH